MGLDEVARIRKAMREVIVRGGLASSLEQFMMDAKSNPSFYFANENELLDAYRRRLAQILPLLPKIVTKIPHTPLSVGSIPGGPAAAYFPTGARLMVNVSNVKIRPKFEVLPLALHEGIPGHHLQTALSLEARPPASSAAAAFEQSLRNSAAFTEGWALYAEGIGEELELYSEPLDEFGRLSADLTRAVRVVVDTGIHAYGWSGPAAKEYFMAQTGKASEAVDEEISRMIKPGTQLAYKVGEQRILRMRRLTQQRLGSRFDVRRFHDALLDWGPLPLDVLERKLDQCLERSCLSQP